MFSKQASPLIDPPPDARVSPLGYLEIVELSRDNPVELIAVLDWEVIGHGLVVLPEDTICAKRDHTVHMEKWGNLPPRGHTYPQSSDPFPNAYRRDGFYVVAS
jgi:hypothetical protein